MTLPPYDIVRETCSNFKSDRVHVDIDAAKQWASELDIVSVKNFGASLASDANFTGSSCDFDSIESEAGMILLLHALDFGSGWRLALHKHHGLGAFLSIKPGVENLYNAHKELLSNDLANISKLEVAQAFNFVGNADLGDLVDLLYKVTVELGEKTRPYGSLPAYVVAKLKAASKETPAGDLVWCLIQDFPETFDDSYVVNSQKVCLYKKAQLVVGELFHRFRAEDQRFNFVDGDKLTAYVDNVICASLRYKKIIVPCQDFTEQIENNIELPMGSEDEVALRAAAVVGVEQVVASTSALSSNELGNYLWGGFGKLPEVRKFQRHATKTLFY